MNMHATEFLEIVHRAMPTREELESFGLDDDEIVEVQRTFTSKARLPSNNRRIAKDEVEKMILENDCSSVEIGAVQFLNEPASHAHGTVVALCEADRLVVRQDGSVVVYDHADPERIQMECAVDSEHLLDGLAAFVEIRRNRSKWRGRTQEAAAVCANKAGGAAYTDFFASLCGFLQ